MSIQYPLVQIDICSVCTFC